MRTYFLWLTLWAAALAAPAWKPFNSPQAHFSGVFPTAPKLSRSQTDSPIGAVTTQIFSSGGYSVAYTELPGAAVRFAADKVVNDARDGVLKDAGGQQQSWTQVNGGWELAYGAPKVQGWSQIFLVGNRLYVLDARVKAGTAKGQVMPFFAKFASQ